MWFQFYPFLVFIHILSCIVWLGFLPVEIYLIRSIKKEINQENKKLLIYKLLSLTNLTGMIGAVGILLTGILMVIILPHYNFFEFKANHWLTTKQFIVLFIMIIIFTLIIPISKKIKISLKDNVIDSKFNSFIRWNYVEKLMVFISFSLGFFHRFYF